MRIKLPLCISIANILIFSFMLIYTVEASSSHEETQFIVNNNTSTTQYVFFSYKPFLGRKEATIFTLKQGANTTLSYPSKSWDKYIQLFGSSEQVKVTGGHRYNLYWICEGRTRKTSKFSSTIGFGTLFITNNTVNPKTVQFRFNSCLYTIHLKPFESMAIPYSKHILDPALGAKKIYVPGSKVKKTTVHDRDNILVSNLLLEQ